MQCANPKCRQDAEDLRRGSLRLIELELPPDERVVGQDTGFPVCAAPSKYFWLCERCSRVLSVRWTTRGVIVESISRELHAGKSHRRVPRSESRSGVSVLLPKHLSISA